jgi:hypothetical protein
MPAWVRPAAFDIQRQEQTKISRDTIGLAYSGSPPRAPRQ